MSDNRGSQPVPATTTPEDRRHGTTLFVIYGIGFSLLCAVILLLNLHALRCASELELSPFERFETRAEIGAWSILGGTGVLSALIAGLPPPPWNAQAGWAYFSLAFVMPGYQVIMNKRRMARFGAV